MPTQVLVTGAARGIGRAIAQAFRAQGHPVALADIDSAAVSATADELGGSSHVLDVRDAEAFHALVRSLDPIEILINNAGVMMLGPFLASDPAQQDRQLAINLGGVLTGCRATLPGMVARGHGHVVNVASVAGRIGTPGAAVYSASKHAVIGLTESLRQELRHTGVHLGCVLPGFTRTGLIDGTHPPSWPRTVSPKEVAQGVMTLVRRRQAERYVPAIGSLAGWLPRIVPQSLQDRMADRLGLLKAFTHIDEDTRRDYRARLPGPSSEDDR